jgi:hypothetical protein
MRLDMTTEKAKESEKKSSLNKGDVGAECA